MKEKYGYVIGNNLLVICVQIMLFLYKFGIFEGRGVYDQIILFKYILVIFVFLLIYFYNKL